MGGVAGKAAGMLGIGHTTTISHNHVVSNAAARDNTRKPTLDPYPRWLLRAHTFWKNYLPQRTPIP